MFGIEISKVSPKHKMRQQKEPLEPKHLEFLDLLAQAIKEIKGHAINPKSKFGKVRLTRYLLGIMKNPHSASSSKLLDAMGRIEEAGEPEAGPWKHGGAPLKYATLSPEQLEYLQKHGDPMCD
jgi:hypothetical protein